MDFRLLGSVGARRGAEPIEISGTKENTLLAALLLARGKVVSDERLTTLLWGWDPPKTVSAQIYTYISRLRKRLGADVEFIRRQPGYLLDIHDSRLDLAEFEKLGQLGGAALQEGHHAVAAGTLRTALGLWSGEALANVTPQLAQAYVPQLEETWATVLEQRIEADLALGAHQELIAELTGLVAEYPLRERLRALLMTALYRCGRQADALHVFYEGRQVLSDELGIDPSTTLTDVYQAVLNGAPHLDAQSRPDVDVSVRPAARECIPSTLPPDLPDFVGREELVKKLYALLRPVHDGAGHDRAHRILVTGMGGVGKTALALHLSHSLRASFSDGQIYVNLRYPNGGPKDPKEVLVGMLHALGEDLDSDRETLDDLVRRYRIATFGKHMLIILDNAVGDLQLEPLLPNSSAPTVLITGRTRMASVSEANTLQVGPMSRADAFLLLTAVVGAGRMAESSGEARDIIAHCAGLPLALRIVGTRLAGRTHWTAAVRLAARLGNPRARLDELRLGDLDVRRSLYASVIQLPPECQVFLSRLARTGRRAASAADVAAELVMPVEHAEQLLETLVDGALMNVVGVDGEKRLIYRLHDLVHLLALEIAEEVPAVVRTPSSPRPWARAVSKMTAAPARLPSMLGRPSSVCQ